MIVLFIPITLNMSKVRSKLWFKHFLPSDYQKFKWLSLKTKYIVNTIYNN